LAPSGTASVTSTQGIDQFRFADPAIMVVIEYLERQQSIRITAPAATRVALGAALFAQGGVLGPAEKAVGIDVVHGEGSGRRGEYATAGQ